MANKVRFSLELSGDADTTLKALAEDRGFTRAEIIRRAIALLEASFAAEKKGLQVGFVDSEGHLKERVIGI